MTGADAAGWPVAADRRLAFHQDLGRLRTDIGRLGDATRALVRQGTAVILRRDLAAAKTLIESDDEIDFLAIDIEERAHRLINRESPVASELRTLIAITKLAGELERSADLMVNAIKASRRMVEVSLPDSIASVIEQMAGQADRLLGQSLDAFANDDLGLALAIDRHDDELDRLNELMIETVFAESGETSDDLRRAVELALTARFYERIGDHAVNIGQRVAFMVNGPDRTGGPEPRPLPAQSERSLRS